jgi:mono/diheme cytochrome c family protein
MLSGRMPRSVRSRLLALGVAAFAAVAFAACGEEGIDLAQDDPNYQGAELFSQNCSGCHTLSVAGTQGSAEDANGREYVDGPNFDQRKVDRDQVLYALANGGFSSGPMPQDILVGEDAEKVADFLAENSGGDVPPSFAPESTPDPGETP